MEVWAEATILFSWAWTLSAAINVYTENIQIPPHLNKKLNIVLPWNLHPAYSVEGSNLHHQSALFPADLDSQRKVKI